MAVAFAQPNARKAATPARPPETIACENWGRYWYVRERGHVQYCERAQRLEQMYIGGGGQWLPEDRAYMEGVEGRKCIEVNEIAEAINTMLGYQVANRVDIAFKPTGQGASEDIATALSKVSMQIADNVKFQWHESQVFADGLIQQRGYFETRMRFDDSMNGEIGLWSLDPLDVIPDPDGKTYDPDDWQDVTITRWLSLDDIEAMYGTPARKALEAKGQAVGGGEDDFGFDMNEVQRNKFGDDRMGAGSEYDAYLNEAGTARYRVIDRQHWKMSFTRVVVFPTGDIRVAENAGPEKLAYWRSQGCIIMQRPMRRVRWTVSTIDVLLHDDWSPYNHFTVVPYFPFFRRGKTKGAVDDLFGPQELLNKSLTNEVHILSETANSGWMVEQHSLTNMTTEDLQEQGARNGLTMEYRKNATKPEKIKPNQVPTGVDNLVKFASEKIKAISGMTDSARGDGGKNQSGVSVQSQMFGAQLSLAIPLDNLARTRHMLAGRWLEMIQAFMTEERLWRITKTDLGGKQVTEELVTGQRQADGTILNDLTVGEYSVVITEQPSQVTFENSQYEQAMGMREAGIAVPDDVVMRYSSLADKAEVIQRMKDNPGDPVAEAKAALAQAQAAVASANATAKNVEALFSAIRTAQIITTMPAVAPIADTIVKSAGFVDKDAGPIYATPGEADSAAATGSTTPPPTNTDPVTPDNPQRGMDTGIEAGPPTN